MKKACCILFFLFFGFAAQSQENKTADSLIQLLPKVKEAEAKKDLIFNIAGTYGEDSQKGLAWYKKGVAFALQNHLDASLFNDAIGIHYLNKQQYDIALNYFLKALAQKEPPPSKRTRARVYDNISIIFDEQDNSKKALYYLDKSLAINKEIKDTVAIADNYMSLGIIYSKTEKAHTASSYYKKALAIYKKAHIGHKIAYAYFNLGFMEDDLPAKFNYYAKAQPLWDEYGPKYVLTVSNLANQAETCLMLSKDPLLAARVNMTTQQLLDKATADIATVIAYSKEDGTLYNLMYGYEVLAKIKEAQNDTKAALQYTRLQHSIKDSVFSQDSKNRIAAVESERGIALRDKQLELNRLTLETKEKQLLYLFIGILLFTAIVVLLFMQSSMRKRNNNNLQRLNAELDAANKIKARLLGILNHDLRSPVASLINLLYLQKEETLTDEKKQELEAKTIASAENLLLSMEDLLLWSKGQMENFVPHIKPVKAESLFTDIKNFYTNDTLTVLQFSNPDAIVFTTDEDYLKTIMRNLTANALKIVAATPGAIISWRAWEENGHSYLSVTDNGPGSDATTFSALYDETRPVGIKSGFGLHLIRELAAAIRCEIQVVTGSNGTTVTLKIN